MIRADVQQTEPARPHSASEAPMNPVLRRLLEEVRNDRPAEARYDRAHNRHNRGK